MLPRMLVWWHATQFRSPLSHRFPWVLCRSLIFILHLGSFGVLRTRCSVSNGYAPGIYTISAGRCCVSFIPWREPVLKADYRISSLISFQSFTGLPHGQYLARCQNRLQRHVFWFPVILADILQGVGWGRREPNNTDIVWNIPFSLSTLLLIQPH